jgi:hypothetical protein
MTASVFSSCTSACSLALMPPAHSGEPVRSTALAPAPRTHAVVNHRNDNRDVEGVVHAEGHVVVELLAERAGLARCLAARARITTESMLLARCHCQLSARAHAHFLGLAVVGLEKVSEHLGVDAHVLGKRGGALVGAHQAAAHVVLDVPLNGLACVAAKRMRASKVARWRAPPELLSTRRKGPLFLNISPLT